MPVARPQGRIFYRLVYIIIKIRSLLYSHNFYDRYGAVYILSTWRSLSRICTVNLMHFLVQLFMVAPSVKRFMINWY